MVSKLFEKAMHKQLNNYNIKFLSPFLCDYIKWLQCSVYTDDFNRKMEDCLDQKKYAGAVLMDLRKAFDTINHELLLAKLHEYGFSKSLLTRKGQYNV